MAAPAAMAMGMAAEAVFATLAERLPQAVWSRVKGDPVQNAFKIALGAAVQRYAVGERLAFASPLLQKGGLLTDPRVAEEFSRILSFERDPNVELIGEKWKAALVDPPPSHSFAKEARLLLGYLESELRSSEVFQPVMQSRTLEAIAASSEASAESLSNIETQLSGLSELLDARFGDLSRAFAGASGGIRNQIRDFSLIVEEKTRGFVGRKWVFDTVENFIANNPRGYFFIVGDPGIGKTALSAQMIKQNGYIHHFNIRAEGINKADIFLKNVCAQLIAAYELEHIALPPEATDDAGFLNKLLGEVSDKLGPGERCVIAVDALDEVSGVGLQAGANPLYLPVTLPRAIYFVVTMRDDPSIMPRVDCEQGELRVEANSAHNLDDVADFLRAAAVRPGIQSYITTHNVEPGEFVSLMLTKSEGNFMYLRYVLPEIEGGAYSDLQLDAIPTGLGNYYDDHWRRMRGADESAWFDYKLPVLVALSVVREPVSIDLISDFSKVEDRRRIRHVLREWRQFLHDEDVEYEGGTQRRWRLYHASFFDFIASRQEIADERVDLKAMHGQIADTLWDDLFGEEG